MCGEKQFWLTGVPRARPRAEGRKRDSSLPLAVPAKNSQHGSFLLHFGNSVSFGTKGYTPTLKFGVGVKRAESQNFKIKSLA